MNFLPGGREGVTSMRVLKVLRAYKPKAAREAAFRRSLPGVILQREGTLVGFQYRGAIACTRQSCTRSIRTLFRSPKRGHSTRHPAFPWVPRRCMTHPSALDAQPFPKTCGETGQGAGCNPVSLLDKHRWGVQKPSKKGGVRLDFPENEGGESGNLFFPSC